MRRPLTPAHAVLAALAGDQTAPYGIVAAVNAGPPKTVDVWINGVAQTAGNKTLAVRYLARYTSPAVGDHVALLAIGSSWLVLDALA